MKQGKDNNKLGVIWTLENMKECNFGEGHKKGGCKDFNLKLELLLCFVTTFDYLKG